MSAPSLMISINLLSNEYNFEYSKHREHSQLINSAQQKALNLLYHILIRNGEGVHELSLWPA